MFVIECIRGFKNATNRLSQNDSGRARTTFAFQRHSEKFGKV
jgi:hypothetical protein